MGWQFWSSIKETGFLSIKLLSHFGGFKSGRSWAFGVVGGAKERQKGFNCLKGIMVDSRLKRINWRDGEKS
jgi:hypothetical protein